MDKNCYLSDRIGNAIYTGLGKWGPVVPNQLVIDRNLKQ